MYKLMKNKSLKKVISAGTLASLLYTAPVALADVDEVTQNEAQITDQTLIIEKSDLQDMKIASTNCKDYLEVLKNEPTKIYDIPMNKYELYYGTFYPEVFKKYEQLPNAASWLGFLWELRLVRCFAINYQPTSNSNKDLDTILIFGDVNWHQYYADNRDIVDTISCLMASTNDKVYSAYSLHYVYQAYKNNIDISKMSKEEYNERFKPLIDVFGEDFYEICLPVAIHIENLTIERDKVNKETVACFPQEYSVKKVKYTGAWPFPDNTLTVETPVIETPVVQTPVETPSEISVTLNGKKLIFDQAPVIQNDRTLVPLRAIAEALGAKVEWDPNTKTVVVFKDYTVIALVIDHDTAYINGIPKELDAPAAIINGHTMVPARFVAEVLNLNVEWDPVNRQVIITDKL